MFVLWFKFPIFLTLAIRVLASLISNIIRHTIYSNNIEWFVKKHLVSSMTPHAVIYLPSASSWMLSLYIQSFSRETYVLCELYLIIVMYIECLTWLIRVFGVRACCMRASCCSVLVTCCLNWLYINLWHVLETGSTCALNMASCDICSQLLLLRAAFLLLCLLLSHCWRTDGFLSV